MAKQRSRLKLGKQATFVKTHLKQLHQEKETWEVDFRPLPQAADQSETHYLGLVVALPGGDPLVYLPVDYPPTVNDLADLLAEAMRRPMTGSPRRPAHIHLRDNPRWEELFSHLKALGIEVMRQDDLPELEEVYLDFRRQMRKASPGPLFILSPRPADVGRQFPAIAQWVRDGHIEIGDQEMFGFVVRALDYGGMVFEDDRPDTLAEAMAALEEGLKKWFEEQGIELE